MNSPQYQTLEGLYDNVANLNARLQRRAGQHACSADAYADKQVRYVLEPLQQILAAYRDFHAGHDNTQGQVGIQPREILSDQIAQADSIRLKLFELCNRTLQRTTSAPGSVVRLSPLFKRLSDGEHHVLCHIHRQLQQVIDQDQARVKEMPRPLRLCSIGGKPV